jgi:hypothetical protein
MKYLKLKIKYFLLGYAEILNLYPKVDNGFKRDLNNIGKDFKFILKRDKIAK